MANMQPEETGLPSTAKPGNQSAGGAGKGAKVDKSIEKVEQTAETVRKKGHDLADTARTGVDSVASTIETASDYAAKAQEMLSMVEQRLDQFIDTAEKLFEKGSKYTGTAKRYLEDNQQYKEKLESVVAKYHEYSDKLKSKVAEKRSQAESGPSVTEKGKEKGKEAMESAKEMGRERAAQFSDTAKSAFRSSSQYVRENPAESVLVGAAVGVLLGTAFRHLRSEDVAVNEQYYDQGQGGSPYGAI